jgi:hypothetical protein
MKPSRALLLSILITAAVQGTSVHFGPTDKPSVPKEPPSTTLVVQGDNTLSEATTTTIAIAPPATTAPEVISIAVSPPVNIIELAYKFNEQSARVKRLQKVIGAAVIDGQYGPMTRKAHIKKLKALGLSTSIVPDVIKPEPRYNISYATSKSCPHLEPTLKQYGLKPVRVFSYIAWRESRCNPKAVNAIWKNGKIVWTLNRDGSYDSGVLQINSSWKTVTSQICKSKLGDLKPLLTVDCNMKVAKFILDNSSSGLGNWRVYKTN